MKKKWLKWNRMKIIKKYFEQPKEVIQVISIFNNNKKAKAYMFDDNNVFCEHVIDKVLG